MTIAEELGFDVVLGDGGAVELNEHAVFAQAFGMHGARDELFAGAAFAEDEHAAIGGSHELDLLAKGFHGDAGAAQGAFDGELSRELLVVLAHLPRLHRVFEDDEGAGKRERLFEEVVGAEFGGADGGLDGAVAADDDDLRDVGGVHPADLAESFEAVAIRQPDVEQHDVVGGVAEQGEGFGGGSGGGDEVAFFREDAFKRLADLGFVVDDEDVVHKGRGKG